MPCKTLFKLNRKARLDIIFCKFMNEGFSFISTLGMDLALLAACNHTILTYGTFGFWAGFLAGGGNGIRILPQEKVVFAHKKILTFLKPKASFVCTYSIFTKWRFLIQFFPEYRRDDSYVNPRLLDHPLGAPLVNSNHSVSSSCFFCLLLHIQTWNLYIYFVILAPFRVPAASFLFRAGWHMKERRYYILIFSFRECPTYPWIGCPSKLVSIRNNRNSNRN